MSDGKVLLVTSVSGVMPAELRLEDLQEELKSLGELIVLLVVLRQKKKQKTIHYIFRMNQWRGAPTSLPCTPGEMFHTTMEHISQNPLSPIKAFRHGRVPLNKGSGGD